ncbi:pectinesterase-like [Panicum virgatum]|uniref:pectinesterase-like n=1 Tax=Panicum virgatum TaxID=38727 RepID=UPI0019D5CD67|nr:pectinesterase-like [Panicum virgatum]
MCGGPIPGRSSTRGGPRWPGHGGGRRRAAAAVVVPLRCSVAAREKGKGSAELSETSESDRALYSINLACPALLGTAVAKGTVDFIFGNATAVLQDYNLHARRPLPNQNSIFTTWAREDPNQNTGGSGHVAAGAPRTYLGHPWKQYSRTVFLQSELDAMVNPIGWIAWDDDFTPDKF